MNRPYKQKLLLQECQGSFWAGNYIGTSLRSLLPAVTGRSALAAMLSLFLSSYLGPFSSQNTAHAQAKFGVQDLESGREQEFRDELDKWMLRAYEGDRDAQFKVGVLFTNDQFDKPDYEQAVYWYKQAARQDHVLAQYNLGHQYLTGVGVAKNDATAMRWWLKAAEQDHSLAQFNVGRAYYLGIGLPMDHGMSKYWFERAAFNQEPKSIDILMQLGWYSGDMTSKPLAPAPAPNAVIRDTNIVLRSPQAEPEPAEASANNFPAEGATGAPLTSRITPVDSPGEASDKGLSNTELEAESEPTLLPNNQTMSHVEQQGDPEVNPQTTASKRAEINRPVALYTNPKVRSVLIAIVDERETLQIVEYGDDWSIVQSSVGFPVWIHGAFVKTKNNIGTIIGQAVNARSVPIITNGSVVGKLDRGEEVAILDKRKDWYRIIAPTHFEAWVKTEDYNRRIDVPAVAKTTTTIKTKLNGWVAGVANRPIKTRAKTPPKTKPKALKNIAINDNEWLFSQPSENFTLQLASFDDPFKVKQFLSRKKFINNPLLHRFTAIGKDIEWTYFLYGSYPDRDLAESTKIDITQKLAWVRTFGRLQQNRCVAWKTRLPTPSELNQYCVE